jgi:hypothetical protein
VPSQPDPFWYAPPVSYVADARGIPNKETRPFRFAFRALVSAILVAATTIGAQQKLRDPKPEPAASAIIAAFAKYSIVALPAGHGYKDLGDFVLALIRHPTGTR